MKKKYIRFFLLVAFSTCGNLYAQFNIFTESPADTNYYDIVNHFLYNYSGTNPDPDGDNELNHFRDWQTFWQPRLAPSGSFNVAAAAKRNNINNSNNPNARTSSLVTSNWTSLGPSGGILSNASGVGRINAIAFEPLYNGTTHPTVYCGGENSGLWKCDISQNPPTWVSLNTDGQLAQLGITSIAVDPIINAGVNNIYVATSDYNLYSGFNFGSAGIYSSSNNGATWSAINVGLFNNFALGVDNSIGKILIDPTNSTDMYAATSDGIYKCSIRQSANPSWTRVYPNATTAEYTSNILFDPGYNGTTNKIIYACGFNIIKSTDGGVTWNSMATGSNGLDLSGTPHLINAPFNTTHPDYVRNMNIAISADGAYLYAGIITTTLPAPPYAWNTPNYNYFYQYDILNTQQWSQQTDYFNSSAFIQIGGNAPFVVPYITKMAYQVRPGNNKTVYSGSYYVYGTTDGGQTYFYPGAGGHSDVRAIEFPPNDPNTIFVGNDGGVYKYTLDASGNVTSTTILNTGLAVSTMFYASSSEKEGINPQVVAGMQDDGLNLLENNIWTHPGLGGDGYQSVMDYKDKNTMYVTDGASIWESTDDGNSFGNDIKPSGFGGQYNGIPLALDPVNPSILYAAGRDLWRSTSGGTTSNSTWQQVSNFATQAPTCPASIFRIAIAPSDPQTIYMSNFTGTFLFKTTNGGGINIGDWTDITPNSTSLPGFVSGYVISGVAVSATDPNHLWISYSGFDATLQNKVHESTDGGQTWSVVPWVDNNGVALPNLPVNCIVYEKGSNDGIYIGTDVGVYYHHHTNDINNYNYNAMSGWEPFMTNLPNVIVNWLEINYSKNSIRAATYGRGLWESDLACPLGNYEDVHLYNSADGFVEAADIISFANDPGTYNLTYRAVNEIDLKPGFQAFNVPNTNVTFHAYIHGCDPTTGNSFRRANQNQTGGAGEGETVNALSINSNTDKESMVTQQSIDVIPNPNGGSFNLRINDNSNQGVYTINITDISGRLVKDMENIKDKNIKMDLTSLPSGFYFVKVVSPSWQSFKKIIIQN
jgi:hypothetical protein